MVAETYLDKIVAQKKLRVNERILQKPLNELVAEVEKLSVNSKNSFYESLKRPIGPSIIAEIKRKSPSKGPLFENLEPLALATEYLNGGASAFSILTEEDFFAGSDDDLKKVQQALQLPILRKDFTVFEYQIWEAKLLGASAILLIAAILSDVEMTKFYELAEKLNLDVLFEVHDKPELERVLSLNPKIVGVNNRNLKTFAVNLQTSFALRESYSNNSEILWVSESGIENKAQIDLLFKAGFKSFLIGETLLKNNNPKEKLRELL